MTDLLVRAFIKNSKNANDPDVRAAYGVLAGITGIICNILLCVAKAAAGIASGSLSVTADAVNNLSDAASSVVTLVGFRISQKPPDKEHPFGHARFEYLSGLTVAAIILIIGFQLGKSSVEKIISPEKTEFTLWIAAVLALSVTAKLWLFGFYGKLAKRISSTSLRTSASDSRNDAITTLSVLGGALITMAAGIELDGWLGLAVAVFIVISGISAVREIIKPLLGEPADEELVREITAEIVGSDNRILGIHDLVVHDYGPGRRFASVHAEIDYKTDVLEAHDIIDKAERMMMEKRHIQMVIHYDPVVTDDSELNEVKELLENILNEYASGATFHDLRIIRNSDETRLVFDLILPEDMHDSKEKLEYMIAEHLREQNKDYKLSITFDN